MGGMKPPFVALGLGILLIAACGEARKVSEEPKAPREKPKPPAAYRVKLETTEGDIIIEVKREWAPRGSDHFWELVWAGFYDGVTFHRVLKEFIAQFGINGNPKTNQLYAPLRIADDPPKLKNKRGTLAYAKLGPNTRATEVFINLRDNTVLDSTGFVPFAKVTEGMEVAGKLSDWYGELAPRGLGPDPIKAATLGNEYLDRHFPKLDAIRKATLLE
jgi:cyclophilin family peptidyl-prolyl cis-trans isomerase